MPSGKHLVPRHLNGDPIADDSPLHTQKAPLSHCLYVIVFMLFLFVIILWVETTENPSAPFTLAFSTLKKPFVRLKETVHEARTRLRPEDPEKDAVEKQALLPRRSGGAVRRQKREPVVAPVATGGEEEVKMGIKKRNTFETKSNEE